MEHSFVVVFKVKDNSYQVVIYLDIRASIEAVKYTSREGWDVRQLDLTYADFAANFPKLNGKISTFAPKLAHEAPYGGVAVKDIITADDHREMYRLFAADMGA